MISGSEVTKIDRLSVTSDLFMAEEHESQKADSLSNRQSSWWLGSAFLLGGLREGSPQRPYKQLLYVTHMHKKSIFS